MYVDTIRRVTLGSCNYGKAYRAKSERVRKKFGGGGGRLKEK